jgi:hypothetical protein
MQAPPACGVSKFGLGKILRRVAGLHNTLILEPQDIAPEALLPLIPLVTQSYTPFW